MGDLGLIPELGRPPAEGKGYPLQYSGLEISVDCIVDGVVKSQTQLIDFHFASNKSISTIFPIAFAHFMFLYNILVILTVFQVLFGYYYICYGDL